MEKSIIHYFLTYLSQTPERIALIYQGQRYSYQALGNAVQTAVDHLQSLQLKQGDVCVVALDNSPGFAALYLAAAELGLLLAPVAGSSSTEILNTAIDSTAAKALIGETRVVQAYLRDATLANASTPVLTWALKTDDLFIHQPLRLTLGNHEQQLPLDYILTMTSGSTGHPKPIVLSQGSKVARSFAGAKDLYRLGEGEVVLVASPMYHSLAQRLTLLPLMTGGTAVILPQFSPKVWLETVSKHRVSFTLAVSSHLEQLVNLVEGYDLTSLRCLVSSSSLLRDEVKKRCLEVFQCDFHECYGASEVGIVTNLTAEDAKTHLSTVGKALPYVDLKIVDEKKQEVATGHVGEIIVKTDTAFSRYYKQPEATAQSVVDGYFYTGDLGWVDQSGFLHLSGRKKDTIIVGGTNVYPQDIETVIAQVPGIKEVAVIGIDDAYFGEAILAVLVTDEVWNLRAVKQACFNQLADYQQPMAFEVVESLPRNAMNKLLKHELKKQFQNYDATAALRKLMAKK